MAQAKHRRAGQTIRLHYIPEWAEHRGMNQAAIGQAIGADKSIVSRWFKGAMPSEMYLKALAELFGLDEVTNLFRSPDDDWLSRFFQDRDEEERARIRRTLEAAFPRLRA